MNRWEASCSDVGMQRVSAGEEVGMEAQPFGMESFCKVEALYNCDLGIIVDPLRGINERLKLEIPDARLVSRMQTKASQHQALLPRRSDQ